MRIILIIIFLCGFLTVKSQDEFSIEKIAQMERQGHQRLLNNVNQSLSSTNFDVKHYRCEWTIDPAVRYIKGVVTSLFQVNTPSNSITYDLMDDLIVDSVRQR